MATKTYQYTPISTRLQNQQIAAMRWLASLGLTAEEIRAFRWRNVDVDKRTVAISTYFTSYIHDREQGIIARRIDRRETRISLPGTGLEWFFLKSATPSLFWAFVKYHHKKNHWRANQQLDILYPLDEIEEIIRDVIEIPEKISANLLTFEDKFATLESVEMNITNSEDQEQTTTMVVA